MLYQHFPGKLELYLALLDCQRRRLVTRPRGPGRHHGQQAAGRGHVQAYFDFVADQGEAFRLVFESDLTDEPAVRDRVDRRPTCAPSGSQTIAEDTGLSAPEAHLLAVGLTGMAEVTARCWLSSPAPIPRDEATRLLAALSWRGIGGFPRQT